MTKERIRQRMMSALIGRAMCDIEHNIDLEAEYMANEFERTRIDVTGWLACFAFVGIGVAMVYFWVG